MSLPLTTPEGSTYRLYYEGPVGVVGVGATQAFDLTTLPLSVRQDPTFEDNFRVFVRSSAPGVTDVQMEPSFNYVGGLPTEIVLTFTSDNVNNNISVEAWYIHSVVR